MGNVTAGAAANCKDSLDTQCNKRRKPQDQIQNILSLMGGFGIARAFRWRFKMPVLFCFRWFNFSVFFRSIKGWELPASTLDIGEQMVEDSNWRVRGIQPLATHWSRNSDHNCVFFCWYLTAAWEGAISWLFVFIDETFSLVFFWLISLLLEFELLVSVCLDVSWQTFV